MLLVSDFMLLVFYTSNMCQYNLKDTCEPRQFRVYLILLLLKHQQCICDKWLILTLTFKWIFIWNKTSQISNMSLSTSESSCLITTQIIWQRQPSVFTLYVSSADIPPEAKAFFYIFKHLRMFTFHFYGSSSYHFHFHIRNMKKRRSLPCTLCYNSSA